MGLDITHDCYHGGFHTFNYWRIWLAKQIGLPLDMMQGHTGYYVTTEEVDAIRKQLGADCYNEPLHSGYQVLRHMQDCKGISWQSISDPLKILLDHSDCDGCIRWHNAGKIALRLLLIIRQSKDDPDYSQWYETTKRFALGCCQAYQQRENILFR